jgi:hypothetical protein
MGSSSKVILVGATALIVGVYAISLKKAETDGINAAMKNMKRVQMERNEDSALRAALDSFVVGKGAKDASGGFEGLDGKTNYYYIHVKGNKATVSLLVQRDGEWKEITSTLEKVPPSQVKKSRQIRRGEWGVTQTFSQR